MSKKIKVLLAKAGLDPHEKGIKLLARTLKEVGELDVVYTGLYRSVDEIIETAVREEVNVLGLSVHTGMQMTLFPEIREKLNQQGAKDITLIGGGVIPSQDIEALKADGVVEEIFRPSQSIQQVIDWIHCHCAGKASASL